MDNYLDLIENNHTNEELIQNIADKKCEDFVRIFSVISLKLPLETEQFRILINNLVNNPTPLREAVSLKLEEINRLNPQLFNYKEGYELILKGITDINPNISRAVCSIIENNTYLKSSLEEKIIEKIENILDSFENYQNSEKNHAKNKKTFSLYWLLEALSVTITQKNNEKILNLVTICLNFASYTIREKSAKILGKMNDCPKNLIKKVKQDENFYVKKQVYDKIDNEID